MLSKELEVRLNEAFADARDQRHEFMTIEHLLLAFREVLGGLRGGAGTLKGLHDLPRDVAGHGCSTVLHLRHRFENFLRREMLDQIARGPGFQGLEDMIRVLIHGQHHYLRLRKDVVLHHISPEGLHHWRVGVAGVNDSSPDAMEHGLHHQG